MSTKKSDGDGKKSVSLEEKIEKKLELLGEQQGKILNKLLEQEEETNTVVATQNEMLQQLTVQLQDMHEKMGQLSDRNEALLRKIRKMRDSKGKGGR